VEMAISQDICMSQRIHVGQPQSRMRSQFI